MVEVNKGRRLVTLLFLMLVTACLKCDLTTGEPTPFSSEDNSLKSLILSGNGSLDHAFNPQVLNYTDTVKESVESITVTPEANYRMSQITINGAECQSGTASEPIPLVFGNSNEIIIQVTSEDGSILKYTVTVVRSKDVSNGEMDNAKLSKLTINAGTLDPIFDSAAQGTTYTANVNVSPISLQATAVTASISAVVAITSVGFKCLARGNTDSG